MCPEYGVYHTRLPDRFKKFESNEPIQFLPVAHIKVSCLVSKRKFNDLIHKNNSVFLSILKNDQKL